MNEQVNPNIPVVAPEQIQLPGAGHHEEISYIPQEVDVKALLSENSAAHREVQLAEEKERQLRIEQAQAKVAEHQTALQTGWLGDQTTAGKTHRQLSTQANTVKSFESYLESRPKEGIVKEALPKIGGAWEPNTLPETPHAQAVIAASLSANPMEFLKDGRRQESKLENESGTDLAELRAAADAARADQNETVTRRLEMKIARLEAKEAARVEAEAKAERRKPYERLRQRAKANIRGLYPAHQSSALVQESETTGERTQRRWDWDHAYDGHEEHIAKAILNHLANEYSLMLVKDLVGGALGPDSNPHSAASQESILHMWKSMVDKAYADPAVMQRRPELHIIRNPEDDALYVFRFLQASKLVAKDWVSGEGYKILSRDTEGIFELPEPDTAMTTATTTEPATSAAIESRAPAPAASAATAARGSLERLTKSDFVWKKGPAARKDEASVQFMQSLYDDKRLWPQTKKKPTGKRDRELLERRVDEVMVQYERFGRPRAGSDEYDYITKDVVNTVGKYNPIKGRVGRSKASPETLNKNSKDEPRTLAGFREFRRHRQERRNRWLSEPVPEGHDEILDKVNGKDDEA